MSNNTTELHNKHKKGNSKEVAKEKEKDKKKVIDESDDDSYETCDDDSESEYDDSDSDSYESSFIDDDEYDEDESDTEYDDDDDDDDDDEDDDEDDEDEDDYEDDAKRKHVHRKTRSSSKKASSSTKKKVDNKKKKSKFNFILSIKSNKSSKSSKDEEEENEDVSVSSVDTKDLETKQKKRRITPTLIDKATVPTNVPLSTPSASLSATSAEELSEQQSKDLVNRFMQLYEQTHDDALVQGCIKEFENNLAKAEKKREKKQEKQKEKYCRIFQTLLRNSHSVNDYKYFKTLTSEKQVQLIKEMKLINESRFTKTPYRIRLLELPISTEVKVAAMQKVALLKDSEPGSGEYLKCKTWVEGFMKIPFNSMNKLPISIADGVEKCDEFISNAKKTLDDAVFGLDNAKMQVIQWLGQVMTNPDSVGTSIAIHGPPGTGKTSLVKEGISKILNRPFAFIALGGATDSSFLDGHGYTYEGSCYGKIVQILIESKCMNPIIYFDELDKISETPKGEEIAGILTHLTDSTQNSQFHDKFFSELDFDLSKCLFIFSYNDETKVNPILKDRMYRIMTKGFDMKQKVTIARNYMIPKIVKQIHFQSEDIIFTEEIIQYILNTFTQKEDGVRNLKRCIESIISKLNLFRLLKPENLILQSEFKTSTMFEFPVTVDKEMVDKFLSRENMLSASHLAMYV
jgi:ATP-dependent Lon protease